jgi:hypothetical protein
MPKSKRMIGISPPAPPWAHSSSLPTYQPQREGAVAAAEAAGTAAVAATRPRISAVAAVTLSAAMPLVVMPSAGTILRLIRLPATRI